MNKSLLAYDQRLSPETYRMLSLYRALIEDVFSGGEWELKYGIPTYVFQGKNLIHVGVNQHHLGVYPGPKGIQLLLSIDSTIQYSKGTWKIPFAKAEQSIPLMKQFLTRLQTHETN
jgi:uncharacterized protein YdhG (YjbR/CyaY superfamily)